MPREASRAPRFGLSLLQTLTAAAVLIALLQFLTGWIVLKQLERRLELKVAGTFWPIPLQPSFFSSDARFEWKNKVTLLSGSVKIDYNVFPWIAKNSIRIKIKGNSIRALLGGEWARLQGVEKIRVDEFDADVEVAKDGLGEIYLVRAESPSFHFHIQQNHKT